MHSKINAMSYPAVTAAVALLGAGIALGWFLHDYLQRAAESPDEAFRRIQSAHLARLDRAAGARRVVFVGSSTFQALDVSAITPNALNLSVGGDGISGLTERALSYQSIRHAATVVVNIGFNDVIRSCRSPDMAEWQAFLRLLPPDLPVIVVGIQGVALARSAEHCDGRVGELAEQTNAALEQSCYAHARCRFVPNPVPTHPAPEHARLQEPDGIHLTPDGYRILIRSLRMAIEQPGINP